MSIANEQPRLQRGFGVVAKSVIRDKSIRGPARLLYALLATYADDEGVCYPSNETLAEDLGATPKSVQNWMGELVEAGVVERVPRFIEGRQTASLTRLIDTVVSQGEEPALPLEGERALPPGGEPPFLQNKTTKNKTTKINPPSGGDPTGTQVPGSPAVAEPAPPRRRKNPTTAAPDLFPLTDSMLDWGRERGAPSRQWLERETERFLNWARARDERYSNWTAAWRNWVLKDLPEVGAGPALLDESGYAPDDKRR